jgi:isopenicillin N synthase-like dioxygenase
VKIGRELVTQSTDAGEIAKLRNKAPDTKETMEIGRDWDKTWRNHWPQEGDAPGFKQTMIDFFKVRSMHHYYTCFATYSCRKTCHETHCTVMRAIALGLDLDEMFFDDKINEQYHNLRLLSYPPIKTSLLKEGQNRAGAHSGAFPF